MTPVDLRTLCAALGFTAVVMQGGNISAKERALRAADMADSIEEFCRTRAAETADGMQSSANAKLRMASRMAAIIVESLKEKGACIPQDLTAKGFIPEDVNRHWAMANALAHVSLNKVDS